MIIFFCADPPDTINSNLAVHLHYFHPRLDEDGGGPTPGGLVHGPPSAPVAGGSHPRGAGGPAGMICGPLLGSYLRERCTFEDTFRTIALLTTPTGGAPTGPGGGGTIAPIGKEETVVCRRVVETGRGHRFFCC